MAVRLPVADHCDAAASQGRERACDLRFQDGLQKARVSGSCRQQIPGTSAANRPVSSSGKGRVGFAARVRHQARRRSRSPASVGLF